MIITTLKQDQPWTGPRRQRSSYRHRHLLHRRRRRRQTKAELPQRKSLEAVMKGCEGAFVRPVHKCWYYDRIVTRINKF